MPDKEKKQSGLRTTPGEYIENSSGHPSTHKDDTKSFKSAQDRAADSSQGDPETENEKRARGNVPATEQGG